MEFILICSLRSQLSAARQSATLHFHSFLLFENEKNEGNEFAEGVCGPSHIENEKEIKEIFDLFGFFGMNNGGWCLMEGIELRIAFFWWVMGAAAPMAPPKGRQANPAIQWNPIKLNKRESGMKPIQPLNQLK